MSDYPMLISNKLHSFRNFSLQKYKYVCRFKKKVIEICDLWQIFCYKNISFAFCR